ncbi:MAG: DUF3892 domain-containing protein [Acidimicrobiia bacterium]|nr:DUF3892 domain-containing protein [Acidimicrobiia bacterium]
MSVVTVIAVCNPDEWWSPRHVSDIIVDIQTGQHTYHLITGDGRELALRVVAGTTGTMLRTETDTWKGQALADVADC